MCIRQFVRHRTVKLQIQKAFCSRLYAAVAVSVPLSVVSKCLTRRRFQWTKLGTLLAIAGADGLEAAGFTGIPLCVAFIILCSFVNIFVSSGSAKWAIFAPIFVPMFMLLGYHPGFTQLLYRIGDSPFNCWTPMSAYIWMILSVAQTKYVPDLKIGTLISNMIPMSIVLQIAWIIVVVIWMMIGLPFGPGVGVALPAGIL